MNFTNLCGVVPLPELLVFEDFGWGKILGVSRSELQIPGVSRSEL